MMFSRFLFYFSKIWMAFEMKGTAVDGMIETEHAGMQAQTRSLAAIEGVAHDGHAESFGMGAVHA